jgi:sporulation protein YlmC with PRC-barrel domain
LFAPSVLNKLGFTGNFIGNTPGKISLMFILVLSFFILFLLVFSIGQLTRLVGKKRYENSISSLISKQVYSSNGYLIGKVKEVILKDNKIHSLVLDLDKKYNSSKGIVIEYKAVKNIKSVVIIDEKVIPHLPSF